jgi:hypothetical protein
MLALLSEQCSHSRTRLRVTETSMLSPVAFAMRKMQTSIFNKIIRRRQLTTPMLALQ